MKLENQNIIEKFLLGEMSEEERFDFEEKFITDEKLFAEINVVEDELIEKYVRGWMDRAEQKKFEKSFLITKNGRRRVEFSRQLLKKLEEQKEEFAVVVTNQETVEEESLWDKFIGIFSTPKLALASGFALLLVAFGSWFLFQNFSNKPEFVKKEETNVPKTPEEVFTPTPEVSPVDSPDKVENNQNDSPDLNKNTDENNSSRKGIGKNVKTNDQPRKTPTPRNSNRTNPKKTPKPVKTPPIPRTAPNPVLTLLAGTVRSEGKNNVLNLPKNAQGATLRLKLESIDYKTYQAQLTDADGKVLFQRANLKARKLSINFFIPAKNLKRGDYIIKLFGKNDAGENESVADFQFRVNR